MIYLNYFLKNVNENHYPVTWVQIKWTSPIKPNIINRIPENFCITESETLDDKNLPKNMARRSDATIPKIAPITKNSLKWG